MRNDTSAALIRAFSAPTLEPFGAAHSDKRHFHEMKRKRKPFRAIQCPGYQHPLTKELSGVLRQTQGERFSRFDAFRSLLERQAARNEADPDHRPCRFDVTYTGLAEEWGWHRHTVVSFFQSLEEIGVIRMERTTVCVWISIPGLEESPQEAE